MKKLIPLLALLAACKPPPPDFSAITAELAALRQAVDEVRKVNQPKLEAVEAMDDLAREVKQLRQKVVAPPPPAPAPAGALLKTGDLIGGVGGTQSGVNDLYWVLSRVEVGAEQRMVLCLYRAQPGRGFNLEDVRMLNLDMQVVELQPKYHYPSIAEVQKALERQKK